MRLHLRPDGIMLFGHGLRCHNLLFYPPPAMVNPCGLWVDTGQPHDTSALALLLMQDCSRYLSMLGIFAAERQLFESVDVNL